MAKGGSIWLASQRTELGNKSGAIVEAALPGPVEITSRGKRKFVLRTYDRLKGSAGKPRACRTDQLTAEGRMEFLAGLDKVASKRAERDE
jgi:antitoxin Phd